MSPPRCATCDMIAYPDLPHECPEPLPYKVALSYAQTIVSPGAQPIHPRLYASIKLGLEGGPPPT